MQWRMRKSEESKKKNGDSKRRNLKKLSDRKIKRSVDGAEKKPGVKNDSNDSVKRSKRGSSKGTPKALIFIKKLFRVQLEERKLLLTQRRLEAVRLLTFLFDKMKTETEYNEIQDLEREIESRRKAEQAKKDAEEEKKKAALEEAQKEKMEKLGKQ